MTARALLVSAFMASCLAAPSLEAQHQLPGSLSLATRDTLARLVDSVRAAGLPTDPLFARAAEGVLKRAAEERIIWAVRALARRQADARAALPDNASAGTLAAAVSALQAGASPQSVRRLSSIPRATESDVALALVAVADLAASRVPAEAAASAIEELLRRGASEQTMNEFRSGIAQDIRSGLAPDAALALQTTALVRSLDRRPAGDLVRPPRARPRTPPSPER